jgi:hypothetical protein
MEYFREGVKVIYHSKDGTDKKTYDALEWIAAMGPHVPLGGEQMVKYYAVLELLKGKAIDKGNAERTTVCV